MLLLSEKELPDSIDVAGKPYDISVDFRDWIRVDLVLRDPHSQ